MEGIPVKISEKYKPPRKIALPASVHNKLNAELKLEKYDFELEHFVLGQMAKLKEEQKKISDSKDAEAEATNVAFDANVSQSNILTPVPLKPHAQSTASSHQVIGGINISDFENDTSSPFDSVELKTLNDMEELAHVLGSTAVSGRQERWPENGGASWVWGCPTPYQQPPPTASREFLPKPVKTVDNDTSTILHTLQKHIEQRRVPLIKKKVIDSPSGLSVVVGSSSPETKRPEKKRDILPDPFPTLNVPCQALARRLAEMGFPLPRAARATQMFGPEEGKVIEWMLEVQALEEAGYPGERAEWALTVCKQSEDEARKLLDTAAQIMRLGFPETEVMEALVKTGLNRDKALDSLIS